MAKNPLIPSIPEHMYNTFDGNCQKSWVDESWYAVRGREPKKTLKHLSTKNLRK